MKPIISVEGLGKSYTIQHEGQTSYKSLREEIFKLPKQLLQHSSQTQEEFWALKDVSFDVMPGERVGIIGRNGAGKSTLLKMLSRITDPTIGRITLRGRAASLLEVGTGFHPELTGRENIFLNGAILGMSRVEVRRKFDEIVDFAGVEKFLDTPVKRYSSGMYVRLAFAVAAHLEPEILIVDEVLAVGDIEFQKKCLGKMEAVSKEGRTLLFVSHQMGMISKLCQRGLFFKNGKLVMDDAAEACVQKYLSLDKENNASVDFTSLRYHRVKPKEVQIIGFSLNNIDEAPNTPIRSDKPCEAKIMVDVLTEKTSFGADFSISGPHGKIMTFHSMLHSGFSPAIMKGRHTFLCRTDPLRLYSGSYSLSVCLSRPNLVLDAVDDAMAISVLCPSSAESATELSLATGFGTVLINHQWELLS
ncbi:MAG: ABC transporter ATP-binding protein [Desulfovibrio sp.]|uniref:ABC transporter ATP-binding protein n=1 Tax=Desulfovibrio sp. TaxID=885 RepID=UPI0039E31180